MESYLKIPVTFAKKGASIAFERIAIEDAIIQFINLLVTTHQGECSHNYDFGYGIWSNEFEHVLNTMQLQPRLMEQLKYMLDVYELRITEVEVREPGIKKLRVENKTDRDFTVTLTMDYRIISTKDQQRDVKISFEY
ncbi:MAG: GPW/gp25 family protein [Bacteroidales bacterium]